jgi:low temperature requirement protein LtrA
VSDLAEADTPEASRPRVPRLLRDRSGGQRVTNIELFFDLVYVFAVTQLSHYLLRDANLRGVLQAGLLLAMVWLVWVYTTWVTNWLDPDQMAVRLLLVALMLISLAMSASLPRAFEDLGLWVGAAYAIQQLGRTAFMVIALRGHRLQRNFLRIGAWCAVSSAFAVAGAWLTATPGICSGWARSASICSGVSPVSPPPGSAGPAPRTGPSRAVTSPSAARPSSSSPWASRSSSSAPPSPGRR